MKMASKASLNTSVQVRPSRSQVVLVLLILVSAGCFFTGFAFLWEGKDSSWVPLSIGVFLCAFVVFAWFRAQKDTDLENSSPTTFADGSGNQITTDTRALMSPAGVQNMERLFSVLAHRSPLPEPDGLIDDKGNPIPNTEKEARARVRAANQEAQAVTDKAVDILGVRSENEYGVQPLTDEPYSEYMVRTNIQKN